MPEMIEHRKTTGKRSLASFPDFESMCSFALDYVRANRREEFEKCQLDMTRASLTEPTEHLFLREYVWCVHVAGMKASSISAVFGRLLQAHNIEDDRGRYVPINEWSIGADFDRIYQVWNHKQKALAVQKTRQMILSQPGASIPERWAKFRDSYVGSPPRTDLIGKLPFMGPALRCQLARNLGNLDVVKPDVHLNRLAKKYKFKDAQEMCESEMCGLTPGAPAGFVDLILWMASADNGTR